MSDHHPLATVEFEFKFGSREFWSAVELRERLLREPLRRFTERGGVLRLITTSYLGASDPGLHR